MNLKELKRMHMTIFNKIPMLVKNNIPLVENITKYHSKYSSWHLTTKGFYGKL